MIRSIPHRTHLVALLCLVLAPLILLGPCLWGDRQYLAWDAAQFPPKSLELTPEEYHQVTKVQNTDITELHGTFLPELNFIRQELAEGRMPHWNPYDRSGLPVWASSLIGFLDPFNWPFLILNEPVSG